MLIECINVVETIWAITVEYKQKWCLCALSLLPKNFNSFQIYTKSSGTSKGMEDGTVLSCESKSCPVLLPSAALGCLRWVRDMGFLKGCISCCRGISFLRHCMKHGLTKPLRPWCSLIAYLHCCFFWGTHSQTRLESFVVFFFKCTVMVFLLVWQFGHLVPLHLPFQYFRNAIQTNTFLCFFFFWFAHHFGYKNISKCSFMAFLLLFSPCLCKTEVIVTCNSCLPLHLSPLSFLPEYWIYPSLVSVPLCFICTTRSLSSAYAK